MDIIQLASGRKVAIRSIRSEDLEALRDAYDRLSPESQYRRFLAPKPHLSTNDARYLSNVDGRDHFALVATPAPRAPEVARADVDAAGSSDELPGAGDDDAGRILAVARFVRLPEDPTVAELAIVVGDPYQREGLAIALLRHLREAALARGIVQFRATMLADNLPAHRLMRQLSASEARERHLGTVDEMDVVLEPEYQSAVGGR